MRAILRWDRQGEEVGRLTSIHVWVEVGGLEDRLWRLLPGGDGVGIWVRGRRWNVDVTVGVAGTAVVAVAVPSVISGRR